MVPGGRGAEVARERRQGEVCRSNWGGVPEGGV